MLDKVKLFFRPQDEKGFRMYRFLIYLGQRYYRVATELPDDISLQPETGEWWPKGRQSEARLVAGANVRTHGRNELPEGTIFVYRLGHGPGMEKAMQIMTEIEQYGRLVCA